MQNIFIVPAMQHGRHAKPLYYKEPSLCFTTYLEDCSSTAGKLPQIRHMTWTG